VFSIFATLDMIDVKMLGVGLAAAVLIDATVVRGVILPAAMAVLGDRAWYLPSWLAWLPGRSLTCEGTPGPLSALRHAAGMPETGLPASKVPELART
jgi:putative drug exporter of the RND superfamily